MSSSKCGAQVDARDLMPSAKKSSTSSAVKHQNYGSVDISNDVSSVQNTPNGSESPFAEARESIIPEEQGTKLQAWFQVLLSHLINFNSFGFMLSFGIFQGYYTEELGIDASKVSWIGTMQLFLVYFVGAFSGRVMDAGYYRANLAAGLLLQLVGVFATSFARSYWQIFLAQGFCQGLGNGLIFCPAVAIVSTYFPAGKRAFAVSLVACGGATGGMVFPAIAQALLYETGFAWTVRIMGFVMLAICLLVLPFSKPKFQPRTSKAWLDLEAFREPPYVLFCVGMFLAFWGLYFAYYYVRVYARDILHVSQSTSFTTLLFVNSFGIPGRFVPALLADKLFTPLDVEIPVILVTGVLLVLWIAIRSVVGFLVWVAVYGFFAGGSQSLFQAASSGFTTNPEKTGVRIGMVFTFVSFACLSGPPICGKLIDARHGDYLTAQIFGGVVMVAGSLFLFAAKVAQKLDAKRVVSAP
jgi:predicted MFS family arabinose efflux permease